MKNIPFLLLAWIICFFAASCHQLKDEDYDLADTPPAFPADDWKKVTDPETFGWSNTKLSEVRDYADDIKTDALMIIDDGKLIAAWGNTQKKYYVASVRKSYLSVLYGFYVNPDSVLTLDATLSDYGIDDKDPTLNADEKKATVRDILTSSSGVYHKSAASDNNDDLPPRNSTQPGETFYYNNWDFNAAGTIFEQRTGRNIFEEFNQRIAQPLRMQDFNWQQDGRSEYSDVSDHPAYHFDMTARDMARFGVLLLNQGQWEGQQVVPADWLQVSTAPQISVGADYGGGGYGYMWWTHNGGEIASAGFSEQSFSAQGNWSQLILIDPVKKIVVVHRAHKRTIDGDKLKVLLQKIVAAKS